MARAHGRQGFGDKLSSGLRQLFGGRRRQRPDQFVGGTVLIAKVLGVNSLIDRFETPVLFQSLRELTTRVEASVNKYGGTLHQTFHGAFTAFFPDYIKSAESPATHADRAMLCGMELQQNGIQGAITAANQQLPIMCLKIGLASGSIITDRVFADAPNAILGRIIDVAHAMADACDVYSVMAPRQTVDFFRLPNLQTLSGRVCSIAMRNESRRPSEALCFDPLESNPAMRNLATEALRALAESERLEHRWPITAPAALPLVTSVGPALPLDISKSGMALLLPVSVPIGSALWIRFDPERHSLYAQLQPHGLTDITTEVRMVVAKPNGFVTGMRHTLLDGQQKNTFLSIILATQQVDATLNRV